MCGRFTLLAERERLIEIFSVLLEGEMPPRYNIAPTQPILIIKAPETVRPIHSNMPPHEAILVRWGFIPAFVKEPEKWPLTFNIRSETVAQKKSFRNALHYRRIIIPASGFFEWQKRRGKKSGPHYITRCDNDLIGFAGLMETWSGANGSEVDTAAIITTAANDDLKVIHHRMPVMLEPKDFSRWLDFRNWRPDEVLDCLKPAANGFLKITSVSEKVNDARYMGPDVITPADIGHDDAAAKSKKKRNDGQLSLF